MNQRAVSFGPAAEAYERFRLGYPDEVFQRVRIYAGRPLITALEIGSGTGKATRLFARHGLTITATDPDPLMLAQLRLRVPDSVATVQSTFEDLSVNRTFDCVYAAAALHWTQREGRWDRVAALLNPGGTFANFGGPAQLENPSLAAAVEAAGEPFVDIASIGSPDGTPADAAMQWPGSELEQSDWFEDIEQHIIRRRLTMSAEDYVGHLSTQSSYLIVPAEDRERVLNRILELLPDQVAINADIYLHLARRR